MEGTKRPTKAETDEDILMLQTEFLKTHPKLSRECTFEATPELSAPPTEESKAFENKDVISDADFVIQTKEVVLDVQERQVSYAEPFIFKPPPVHCIDASAYSNKKPKISKFSEKNIFSQLVEQQNTDAKEKCIDDSSNSISAMYTEELEKVLKTRDLGQIHIENLQKISSMSDKEILEQQKYLEDYLNPETVSFIRNKKKKSMAHSADRISKQRIPISTVSGPSDEIIRSEGKEYTDAILLTKIFADKNVSDESKATSTVKLLEKKNFSVPKGTKQLLDCSQGQWMNMSKIEKEKLEWMAELPKPDPVDLKTGYTARFDFEGKLLACDLQTPTYYGLHHHGADPEMAGYSLEELFLLARSTVQSQRITALHTIAHIFDNYWYGKLDGCFKEPLLPKILQAGLIPLLRWALDDSTLTSLAATITAIHSLLVCKPDQICLQRAFTWLSGHVVPQTEPSELLEPDIAVEELTDADLIKLDVIKAFLRMDTLPRFVYILQTLHPPPSVCKLIVEIICQFVQHSTESAIQVVKQARLMDIIFEKFLPVSWQCIDGSKLSNSLNYVCPMPSAMKLVRLICSSHKKIILPMIDLNIVSIITAYLTIQPIDEKVPLQDFQPLVIESLKTFHALLCYGYGFQIFLDLFPIFLKQFDFFLTLDLNSERKRHCQDFDYATHFFKVLEAVVIVSSGVNTQQNSLLSAVSVFFKKSLISLKKWLWQLSQNQVSDHGMNLLAACLNFVSTLVAQSHRGLICEDWEPCSSVKEVYHSYVLPCLKSNAMIDLLTNLKSFSLLLCSGVSGKRRNSSTLVSLGSVLWDSDIAPPLLENSPFPLLIAVINFAIVHKKLFSDTNDCTLKGFLKNAAVIEYLKEISTCQLVNCDNWFSSLEYVLIAKILELSSLVSDNSPYIHKTALSVLPAVKPHLECLIENLFDSTIFNPLFLREINTEDEKKLASIAKSYLNYHFNTDTLLHSRNLIYGGLELEFLSIPSESKPILSIDWHFFPIYNTYQTSLTKHSDAELSVEVVHQISCALNWIHWCHEQNMSTLECIPPAVQFYYLSMVFLIDGSLFFNPNIRAFLTPCLLHVMKNSTLDLSTIAWNGINGFDDIYVDLLTQFKAVSYGDELFGNVVLFPLQQRWPRRWKKIILTEFSQVLRFLRVPLDKLFVPLEAFLSPTETDVEILTDYFKLLVSGELDLQQCPLPFLMAIHHLNHFLFLTNDSFRKAQKFLLSSVLRSNCKKVRNQIMFYSDITFAPDDGFHLKTLLSSSDIGHLEIILGKPVQL